MGIINNDAVVFIFDLYYRAFQVFTPVINFLGKLKIGRGEPDVERYKVEARVMCLLYDCQ